MKKILKINISLLLTILFILVMLPKSLAVENNTITPANNTSETTETVKGTICGDVNLDGKINIADSILLNKAVLFLVELNEVAMINADCDKTTSGVDMNDAMALLKFIVGLEDKLPITETTTSMEPAYSGILVDKDAYKNERKRNQIIEALSREIISVKFEDNKLKFETKVNDSTYFSVHIDTTGMESVSDTDEVLVEAIYENAKYSVYTDGESFKVAMSSVDS